MNQKTILIPSWPAPKNIRAFNTLRNGLGVSKPPFDQFNLGNRNADSGDDPGAVEKNRALLAHTFQLPSNPHWLRQVHGIDVLRFDKAPVVTGDSELDEPVADAAITSKPDVVLSILTADCLPVFFCNKQGAEVAAAHAGWRGLAAGVLENTVLAMHSPPSDIMAWLGPAAGPKAYEIGTEVRDHFIGHDNNSAVAFMPTRDGHWHVDLYQLARMRLWASGITLIYGGDHCSISEPDKFFSHRRDQVTGRMASIIWLT